MESAGNPARRVPFERTRLLGRGADGKRPLYRQPFRFSVDISHARNLKDEQFAAIRQAGGLVGLNVCASQLGAQTFEQLERHFYHYLSLGGERVVAFGCDFDGTDVPEDWQGVAVMGTAICLFFAKRLCGRLSRTLILPKCLRILPERFDKRRENRLI